MNQQADAHLLRALSKPLLLLLPSAPLLPLLPMLPVPCANPAAALPAPPPSLLLLGALLPPLLRLLLLLPLTSRCSSPLPLLLLPWLELLLLLLVGHGLLLPQVMTRFITSSAAGTIMLTTNADVARLRLQENNTVQRTLQALAIATDGLPDVVGGKQNPYTIQGTSSLISSNTNTVCVAAVWQNAATIMLTSCGVYRQNLRRIHYNLHMYTCKHTHQYLFVHTHT